MAGTILVFLLDWSIRAAALAGSVAVLLWILRIRDARVRLTAWTIVLAAALLMPVAAPVLPQFSIVVPRIFGPWGDQRSPGAASYLPAPQAPDAGAAQKAYHFHWADFAAGAWILVAALMLLRLAIGLRLAARMVRGSRPVENGVRESDLVRVPLTVGVFRPVVLLPPDWRDWPERKLRAVISHEQAHVAERDSLRQLAASIYRSLAWFHPLAWWLRAEIAELAEAASDDAALAAGEDRARYAEMLLGFIERTPRRVRWEGVTMATRQTRMRRIDRILDQNRKLSRPSSGRVAAVLILGALPLIYIATATRPVWAQTRATGLPAPPLMPGNLKVCGGNAAWAAWLNQDVAYIITGGERQAFERLGTEEECAKFAEQFWLRRDPTPGTPKNEFKEEHYRRIAYANQHFASARLPGWQTDRGRVYITYGPPDEIESHSSGNQQIQVPFDEWLYRDIPLGTNVVFQFVDASMSNAYRLSFFGHLLSVQVKSNRTLLITAPVWGGSVPVYGRITDRNGVLVQAFEDTTRANMYGKSIATPLPPGQYTLHLEVGGDDRSIAFEVK